MCVCTVNVCGGGGGHCILEKCYIMHMQVCICVLHGKCSVCSVKAIVGSNAEHVIMKSHTIGTYVMLANNTTTQSS